MTSNSSDAVTGKQLFATNENVTNNANNISNLTKNLNSGAVGLVKQDSNNNITVAKETGGTSVNIEGTDGKRVLTG